MNRAWTGVVTDHVNKIGSKYTKNKENEGVTVTGESVKLSNFLQSVTFLNCQALILYLLHRILIAITSWEDESRKMVGIGNFSFIKLWVYMTTFSFSTTQ